MRIGNGRGGQSSKGSFIVGVSKGKIKISDIAPGRFKPEKMFLIT